MFYVKEELNGSMEITIEINDENVFCTCPHCFKEVQVDIVEVLRDPESDLFGTQVLCKECAKKYFDSLEEG